MEAMNAESAVYAGDSAEDLLMARRAEKETGAEIAFIGVYGYSSQPSKTRAKFRQEGVEAMTKSVNQLPSIVNAQRMKS
jgi:phosphoglycolate phosphatase-like HAD superfamily hydrolase